MTTSLTPSLVELTEEGKRIPDETLEFLRERLRDMLHQLVLREFLRQSRATGLQQKDLALKLGRGAGQISRWIGHPGNRTVDTVSDLLAAMGVVPMNVEVAHALDLVDAEELRVDHEEVDDHRSAAWREVESETSLSGQLEETAASEESSEGEDSHGEDAEFYPSSAMTGVHADFF